MNLTPPRRCQRRREKRKRLDPRTATGRPSATTHEPPVTRQINVTYEDLMVGAQRPSSCDCPDARPQPQHDPLRRGPLHTGQGVALALAQLIKIQHSGDALKRVPPRFGRRDPAVCFDASASATPRTPAAVFRPPGAIPTASAGHAPDEHDARRQAVGSAAGRRIHAHSARSVHCRRNLRRNARVRH